MAGKMPTLQYFQHLLCTLFAGSDAVFETIDSPKNYRLVENNY
ncbi:MAG: hypothetical protein O4751_02630 [Trichodesmium sp. St2_bin6]|nr:hypothetical protein [Trichodesmium sp. St2_bin6]MDE5093786.1 hypothetical protein [Trichodesmium sp. St11_bin5]MDE5103994.1 hypothetical protein [Trichodesmium sp. St19_bin2]MDT9340665.1 hypothetical protein [Trichodesmium erythraeum 21-75]